jgi:hypothetical protein
MNLVITGTSAKTWKAVKRHYFIALASASLALGVMIGGPLLYRFEANNNAAQPATVRSSLQHTSDTVYSLPTMTYFLVGSDEQRDLVLAEAALTADDVATYHPGLEWQFAVLTAGTVEEETEALATLEEVKKRWMATGASGLEIVDRRDPDLRQGIAQQRLPIFVYVVESQQKANDIEAELADTYRATGRAQSTSFVFKATTPEEEAGVTAFVQSWQGRDVRLLDLRGLGPVD